MFIHSFIHSFQKLFTCFFFVCFIVCLPLVDGPGDGIVCNRDTEGKAKVVGSEDDAGQHSPRDCWRVPLPVHAALVVDSLCV
jgi:hypothetical protein